MTFSNAEDESNPRGKRRLLNQTNKVVSHITHADPGRAAVNSPIQADLEVGWASPPPQQAGQTERQDHLKLTNQQLNYQTQM